jgi:uncharacterized protein (DUF1697 family)
MAHFVGLLRGINVGGSKKVPMADLRALAAGLGLGRVRTLIASGNLLFESEESPPELEARLEAAIAARFGFPVPVMVREAAQWRALTGANPFPDEAAQAPNLLMVTLGKRAPTAADVEALRARAAGRERAERGGGALWLWYGEGGRSTLSVTAVEGVWTTRNWRTVARLGEMLDA